MVLVPADGSRPNSPQYSAAGSPQYSAAGSPKPSFASARAPVPVSVQGSVPVPGAVPVPEPVPEPGAVPVAVPGAVPVAVPGPVDSENDSSDDDVVFVGVAPPEPVGGYPRRQIASKVGFKSDPPVGGLRAPPRKKRAHDPQAHPGCRTLNKAMHNGWPVDKKRKRGGGGLRVLCRRSVYRQARCVRDKLCLRTFFSNRIRINKWFGNCVSHSTHAHTLNRAPSPPPHTHTH